MISGIRAEDFLANLVKSKSGTTVCPFTFADQDTGLLWEMTISSNSVLIKKIRGDAKESGALDADKRSLSIEIADEMFSPCQSPAAEGRVRMPHMSLYGFDTSRYLHN